MKKKKPVLILCAAVIQAVLLVFWAMLAIETVCPIYRLSEPLAIVGSGITVYAPVRAETVMTDSAKKQTIKILQRRTHKFFRPMSPSIS